MFKMPPNRRWMYTLRINKDGTSNLQFRQVVTYFLDFAYKNATNIEKQTIEGVEKLLIRCPCKKCKIRFYKTREDVDRHLITQGFMKDYELWYAHGESHPGEAIDVGQCSNTIPSQHVSEDAEEDLGEYTGYDQMVIESMLQNNDSYHQGPQDPNQRAEAFYNMLNQANEPLWEGAKDASTLSITTRLLNWKSDCNVSDSVLEQSPWSSKTPEKPINPPRRPVTRRQALRSVNQVREAAKKLRKSHLKPSVSSDPLMSSDPSTETPIAKPNTSKSLPEKYEVLDKFFNSLESSIRLLGLKGSMSTFANISRTVESLTDRRFAYNHLAQLKFLLPEGIEIKRILVRDDRTSCMKSDLHVTLNFSIIPKLKSDSGSIQMRKLFRSRLVSFFKSKPEGVEVPEEELPEPFNQSKMASSNPIEKPNMGSVQDTTNAIAEPQPAVASHMPQSFKRRFSKRAPNPELEAREQKSQELTPEIQVPIASKQVHSSTTKVDCVSNLASPVKWSAKLPETPIKSFNLDKKEDLSSINGTPSKLISTPFSATPAQAVQPPVRCFMSPDEDTIMSPRKLTRRSSGRRSITFDTPVKNKTTCVERARASSDDDLLDILPVDLLASIKEKERIAIEENDPAISQAKWRKQMIAGLPRLFDILLFYFQSIKRSVITKEELVHRIISSHLEIVDRREVDEQLRLLQELAPEWIYEKMSSTGDLLFCVNKISSPESIRTRLSEAN